MSVSADISVSVGERFHTCSNSCGRARSPSPVDEMERNKPGLQRDDGVKYGVVGPIGSHRELS